MDLNWVVLITWSLLSALLASLTGAKDIRKAVLKSAQGGNPQMTPGWISSSALSMIACFQYSTVPPPINPRAVATFV